MADQKIVTETALQAIASDIKSAIAVKADKTELYNILPTEEVQGALANFTDGADNIPVKSLVSQIVAVQSGSGTPSPSNPRAITGFDSGVVSVCGVNLWDEQWELGLYNSSTGEPFASNSYLRSKASNYILVSPNTNYFICSPKIIRIFEYDSNYQFIKYTDRLNNILLVSENCKYIRFCVYDISYGTTYNNDISINYPSSDTQYHAYNGNNYTFTFGQTVYGGHFDNKGNLVVTHGIIPDLGSLGWAGSDGQFNYSFNVIPKNWTRNSENWGKCSALKVENWDSVDSGTYSNNSIHGLSWNNTIFILRIYASDYSTADELKSALSGQVLVYELATPITLEITSQAIPTLLGENNIFSNCGDCEVEYRADIGLYIDKKLNP